MKNSLQNFSSEGASSQATEEADTTVGTAYFLLCLFAVYFLQVEYVVFDPIWAISIIDGHIHSENHGVQGSSPRAN